jgi:hypothetical protein
MARPQAATPENTRDRRLAWRLVITLVTVCGSVGNTRLLLARRWTLPASMIEDRLQNCNHRDVSGPGCNPPCPHSRADGWSAVAVAETNQVRDSARVSAGVKTMLCMGAISARRAASAADAWPWGEAKAARRSSIESHSSSAIR